MSSSVITVDQYISTSVEVELSMKDLAAELTDAQIREIIAIKAGEGKATGATPPGLGKGDPPESRYIEAAYLAARGMADCPSPIRDLLWHVHGRAI